LSSRRVRELAEAGTIPRAAGGRYPVATAVQAYVGRLREQAAGRLGDDGEGLDLTAERAALARAQRLHTEMRMARERGELVEAEAVKLAYGGMIRSAVNRLRGVPSKAKGRLPYLDVAGIETLESLIDEALVEVADGAEVAP
jgi:phage terminase Nu1 subunit (DNA packaging protein)